MCFDSESKSDTKSGPLLSIGHWWKNIVHESEILLKMWGWEGGEGKERSNGNFTGNSSESAGYPLHHGVN